MQLQFSQHFLTDKLLQYVFCMFSSSIIANLMTVTWTVFIYKTILIYKLYLCVPAQYNCSHPVKHSFSDTPQHELNVFGSRHCKWTDLLEAQISFLNPCKHKFILALFILSKTYLTCFVLALLLIMISQDSTSLNLSHSS